MAESEVEVKLKATGAEETAAAVGKVGDALEDSSKKSGMLDNAVDKVSTGAVKLRNVAAAAGGIGIATAAAAKTFGQIRDALDGIDTTQLRAVDSAMADNIESAKTWATALEDPIGLLLKLTTGETVESAFDGLNDQLQRNADMTSEAVDRFIAKSSIQVEQIKKLSDELKAANALADAKADTAETIRAGKNAKRILNGEAPEDIAAEEAKIQAAEKIAKIEREQAESRVGLQEKYDASRKAAQAAEEGKAAGGRIDAAQNKFNAANMAIDDYLPTPASLEARDAARRELEETKQRDGVSAGAVKGNQENAAAAKKAFEDQVKQIAQSDALANEQKAGIRAGADNSVAESQAKKAAREQSEKQKADQAKARAAAAAAKVAAEARREAQREELEAKRTKLAGTAGANEGKIAGSKNQGKALQNIGKDLGNADSEAEIAAVGAEIQAKQGELGAVTVATLKQMLEGQAKLVSEIEAIKQKFRNQ